MSKNIRIDTIKKRTDFLRLNNGSLSAGTPFFLLLAKLQSVPSETMRVGYTVTKKMGGAVVRNRIKRQFRAAVREVFPTLASPGYDYVLIARSKSVDAKFENITESLRFALSHLHKTRHAKAK